jgi:hypothetical protein
MQGTMSLLNRIAISNGNKLRKAAANLTITEIDTKKVVDWNRSLRSEIYRKTVEDYPAGSSGAGGFWVWIRLSYGSLAWALAGWCCMAPLC